MHENKRIVELAKKYPYLKKVIFIVGSGRSGTTLMHSLLDNHPQLLVWPFEYDYCTLFKDFEEEQGIKEPTVNQLNNYFFWLGIGVERFGKEHSPGVGKAFSLSAVAPDSFHSIMEEYSQEKINRKEYLQLLLYAYHQSYTPSQRPDAFVVKMTLPTDEIIQDFPEARIIYMARNPIETYASIKRFYFKAAEENPSVVYFPGAINRRHRWGLLEVATAPVLYSYNWLHEHKNYKGILKVTLEDLQREPESTMEKLTDFLGISLTPSLLEPTMLGQSYGSNLSSGSDSGGVIMQTESYIGDLTHFELWWTQNLFRKIMEESGYTTETLIPEPSLVCRLKEFWIPMRNEFPSQQNRRRIKRWIISLIHYFTNRLFLLMYSENYARTRFPFKYRKLKKR